MANDYIAEIVEGYKKAKGEMSLTGCLLLVDGYLPVFDP